jgi:predicted Fe-Mo cluster-binding NifX family protein
MNNGGLESDVCAHFGSCEYFTVVDVQDQAITDIETISNISHTSTTVLHLR